MAKTQSSKKVTSEVIKLTEEELKNVVDIQQKINNITLNIGNNEVTKQAMLVEYSKLKIEWDVIAKTMEDKYGQVNVNLNDGSVSPIDPSANPLG